MPRGCAAAGSEKGAFCACCNPSGAVWPVYDESDDDDGWLDGDETESEEEERCGRGEASVGATGTRERYEEGRRCR